MQDRELLMRALDTAKQKVADGSAGFNEHLAVLLHFTLSQQWDEVRARLASLERQWAEGYRADKIEAVTVLEGLAAQMILLEAERVAADMILVFNRRRSPLHRLLHGSVAQQVLSGARIPVVAMPIVDAEPSATNEAVE